MFAFSPIHPENLEMVISMPWQPLGLKNDYIRILALIQYSVTWLALMSDSMIYVGSPQKSSVL